MQRRLPWQAWSFVLLALLSPFAGVALAHAQPPPSNPNHMCGSGEFTVDLPGRSLGIDDKENLNWAVEAPDVARDDEVTLPNGCTIYAFLISGWNDNHGYDQIIFYKLAEFVAQHNGYVHVGWWNNLGKEYMERPLHLEQIRVTQKNLLFPDIELPLIHATPGTNLADAFLIESVDLPKANPDEDIQFVSDLRHVLRAVRDNNPNALIILAGHSMGGKAIVNAVAGTDIRVDLLAAIDPVGNRDRPFIPIGLKHNWTRWRATNDFKGWKVRDCIRNNEPNGTGLCRNFGTLFSPSFQCTTRGNWEVIRPLPLQGSLQPILCPGPVEDTGAMTIGHNIRRLYHRWQTEFAPPLDFEANRLFNRPMQRSSTDKLSPNLQAEFVTCSGGGYDPLDDHYKCMGLDGHGELIGVREKSDLNNDEEEVPEGLGGRVRPGLKLKDWPARSTTFGPSQRRDRLQQLAVDGPNWPYRPKNPDLCLVCQDLIGIAEHMLSALPVPGTGGDVLPTDTLPPTSSATASPEANTQGWFNEDVVVSVGANDNRSVQEIQLTLSGAQTGTTITPGNGAQVTITAEGLTTVSYFARDGSGNEEPPHALDIRIDKTAPVVNALTDLMPNAHGWIGGPVVITFSASDEPGGSGLATSPPDVSVSTQGSNQEFPGPAEDNAGNTGSALVTLSIDLTPPAIALHSRVPSANAAGWNNSAVTVNWNCTDTLSGVLASSDAAHVASEGAGQSAFGTCRDKANHVTTDTIADINIDVTPPAIALESRVPSANGAGWNNTAVTLTWNCTDALSGPVDPMVLASIATQGAGQSRTGQCVDAAQNTANHTQGGVNIDSTNPAAILAAPSNGASYLLNATVAADFGCTDALSGVGSCTGTLPAGALLDTSSVGARIFTVAATDVAANTVAVTHAYSVRYNFTGFALPIRPDVNKVNAGRTVPVKFSVLDANSAFVSALATFASLTSTPVGCDSGEATDLDGEVDGSGQTTIRYDADANQFIYNWKTESSWAGTCRVLTLALADGSEHVARFRFQ